MELKTKRILLRDITIDDIPLIHQLNIIPEVDEYNTMGIPASIADTEQLILPLLEAQLQLPRIRYIWLLENEESHFIGLMGINLGKLNYFSAEVWYKLNPIYWGKGYATEALQAVLECCFVQLKLHRVIAGCAVGNKASMRVLEKTGFKKEAHHRKILPIRGEWVDSYEYAILEEDYLNKQGI